MSTSTFQGLDGERNSSRVLRPPGGGSSDLFGTGTQQTAAESANRQKSKQTSSNIFGEPYDPVRDVRRSDQKAAEQDQKKQEHGQFETPTYVRAEKPQEDTQSKLFGDNSDQTRRGKGQGEEFPVYDRSVYAAQMVHQKSNAQRASSFNPITGETYSGSEDVDSQPAHNVGKRKGGQHLGAYNPITGEEYREAQEKEAASNGDGPQKIRNSSKVLAPPGGKSSGIFF